MDTAHHVVLSRGRLDASEQQPESGKYSSMLALSNRSRPSGEVHPALGMPQKVLLSLASLQAGFSFASW